MPSKWKRRSPQHLVFTSYDWIPASGTDSLTADRGDMTVRNFKPSFIRLSLSAYNAPCIFQAKLWKPASSTSKDLSTCHTSPPTVIPTGQRVSLVLRWPRSTPWFSAQKASATLAEFFNLPGDATSKGIIYYTRHLYVRFDSQMEVKPLLPTGGTSYAPDELARLMARTQISADDDLVVVD